MHCLCDKSAHCLDIMPKGTVQEAGAYTVVNRRKQKIDFYKDIELLIPVNDYIAKKMKIFCKYRTGMRVTTSFY